MGAILALEPGGHPGLENKHAPLVAALLGIATNYARATSSLNISETIRVIYNLRGFINCSRPAL